MKAKLTKQWGFDCTILSEGTEVTIIKGMEADASDVLNAPYGMCYLCEYEGSNHYIPATHLTITDWSNIDWEQRRYEIAKEAMTAIMSNADFYGQVLDQSAEKGQRQIQNSISEAAVIFADALIEELKKKKP